MAAAARAETMALMRRCLRAARRCPAHSDRELMRAYAIGRFRDAAATVQNDAARARRLLAEGREEVGRFEALHDAVAARAKAARADTARADSPPPAHTEPHQHPPAPAAPRALAREAALLQPRAVETWDADAVGEWLDTSGLGAHRDAFRARDVCGRLLLELDDDDLRDELGVASRLDRKRLLAEIRALARGDGERAPPSAAK